MSPQLAEERPLWENPYIPEEENYCKECNALLSSPIPENCPECGAALKEEEN